MKKIHSLITKIEPPNWVLGILALIVLLRIPSFFEPYYYGDEMIYLTLGNAIRKGLSLYSQIHDNKPPLLYLIATLSGNLFWFKAILMFWMLATTAAFWHLTKNLFENNKLAQKVSVVTFAVLTTIPLFEGQIVNAELFLIGPIIIALVILLTKPTTKNIFLAGILYAFAALFKIPAIFDLSVIFFFWLFATRSLNLKNLSQIATKTFFLALGLLVPISLTFIFYFLQGSLSDYFTAAFLQNLGYVSSWQTAGESVPFLEKHGPLLMRAAIVLVGLLLLKIKSPKLSKPFLLATIWLLTSLFAATLSGRPYPHYMIQAVPAISLLVGILVSSTKFEQVLTIIPLTLAVLVPVYFNFYYYPTSSYYARFLSFSTGQNSKWDYFNAFDPYTKGNYELSRFLMESSLPSDRIFVWGDSAPIIYALTKRIPAIKYTATYHIDSFSTRSLVLQELESARPRFIIIPPNSPSFGELRTLANENYIMVYDNHSFEVWHLLSN